MSRHVHCCEFCNSQKAVVVCVGDSVEVGEKIVAHQSPVSAQARADDAAARVESGDNVVGISGNFLALVLNGTGGALAAALIVAIVAVGADANGNVAV